MKPIVGDPGLLACSLPGTPEILDLPSIPVEDPGDDLRLPFFDHARVLPLSLKKLLEPGMHREREDPPLPVLTARGCKAHFPQLEAHVRPGEAKHFPLAPARKVGELDDGRDF